MTQPNHMKTSEMARTIKTILIMAIVWMMVMSGVAVNVKADDTYTLGSPTRVFKNLFWTPIQWAYKDGQKTNYFVMNNKVYEYKGLLNDDVPINGATISGNTITLKSTGSTATTPVTTPVVTPAAVPQITAITATTSGGTPTQPTSKEDFKKTNPTLTEEQATAAYDIYLKSFQTTTAQAISDKSYAVKEIKVNNKVIGYVVGTEATVYTDQNVANARSTTLKAEAEKTQRIDTFKDSNPGSTATDYVSSDSVTPVMKKSDGTYWQYISSAWSQVQDGKTITKVTKQGDTTITETYTYKASDKSFTEESVIVATGTTSVTMTPDVYSSLGIKKDDTITASSANIVTIVGKDGTTTATITDGNDKNKEKATIEVKSSSGTLISRSTTNNEEGISSIEKFETLYYDKNGNSISADAYSKLKTPKEKDEYKSSKTTHTSHTATVTTKDSKGNTVEVGKINYDYSYYTENGIESAAMITYTNYAKVSGFTIYGAPGTTFFYVKGDSDGLNNNDLNGILTSDGTVDGTKIVGDVAVVTFKEGKASECKGSGCGDANKQKAILAEADKAQNQAASRAWFSRFDFALTKFRGLSGFSSLIWGDDELNEWRENVDELFAKAYLGTEYWTSEICKSNIEDVPSNVAMVETAPGVFQAAATVSAERSPAIPFTNETINITQNTVQYLYKISAYVKAVEDDTKFNIYVIGSNLHKPVLNETKSLNEGESYSLTGNAIIVKYSFYYYDKICLEFESGDIPDTCNAIPEATGIITAPTTTTTTTGTGAGWEEW